MKVYLVGMVSRDQAAFDLFMKRHFPDWRWQAVDAASERVPAVAAGSICLLDLAAMGMARHSIAAQTQLLAWVGGQPAVLLLSRHDVSWQAACQALEPQPWQWLGKPYNAESMRAALELAARLIQTPAVTQQPIPTTPAGGKISPEVNPLPLSVAPPPAVVITAASDTAAPGLDVEELAQRLAASPLDRFVLLRKMLVGLQQSQAFELRFTVQHLLLVHPLHAWVAGNMPLSVVQRVCTSDALARSITLKIMTPAEAEQRVLQLGLAPQELGIFLLALADAVLPQVSNSSTMAT
ncbi:MAG: hypothetical protein KBF66_11780 [Rhodoferax sp.]|uniref:hypothetical protein n=1 Tax=Rhodoferax sp. TaxID=50421 RepID=UPI001B5C3699|nr:hypothetical protein [Rhodoferax sp.]MBP9906233.1 hypothetical protein [Rhodoferax sp.]